MKRKELKNLAQKIAKYEQILQTSQDKEEIREAQSQIMNLSGRVQSLEDMVLLDDMIQEILKKFDF